MAVYLLALAWFILGTFRKGPAKTDQQTTVSVIVAARGECPWLPRLADQLANQDYPAEKMQFVLVDDGLDAARRAEMDAYAERQPNMLVVSSDDGDQRLSHKNRALDAGIKKSVRSLRYFPVGYAPD